jgi:hypothetical protein
MARVDTGKFPKRGVRGDGKNFAHHLGCEVLRRVVGCESQRASYDPTTGAHCVHLILRLKTADNLEDFIGALLRHGLNKLHARVSGTRKVGGLTEARPEMLVATVEDDRHGVHVHAVLYNRAPVTLTYFAKEAAAVFGGFTAVATAHVVELADDTRLVRVAGYGLKRAVPIMAGRYPAVFLGQLYTAKEWRELAKAFSRVLP